MLKRYTYNVFMVAWSVCLPLSLCLCMVPTDLEKCLNLTDLTAVLKSAWSFNLPEKLAIFLEKCMKMTFMVLKNNGPRNLICLCVFYASHKEIKWFCHQICHYWYGYLCFPWWTCNFVFGKFFLSHSNAFTIHQIADSAGTLIHHRSSYSWTTAKSFVCETPVSSCLC